MLSSSLTRETRAPVLPPGSAFCFMISDEQRIIVRCFRTYILKLYIFIDFLWHILVFPTNYNIYTADLYCRQKKTPHYNLQKV